MIKETVLSLQKKELSGPRKNVLVISGYAENARLIAYDHYVVNFPLLI